MSNPENQNKSGGASSSLTPEEIKQRNNRNLAIAAALLGFVALVFLVTMLRLGGAVADRSF